MNAIVGDNGIVTQAQNENIMQSCAILEEYLQECYVAVYDDFDNENKVDSMMEHYQTYFYNPRENGYGTLNFIEKGGKSFYLINKSGFPDEIKSQLKGGDAGDGSYQAYENLQDVYGVTEDLKVYYCNNGLDTIMGMNTNELDDVRERVVFDDTNSNLANILSGYDVNGDGKLTSTELKTINSLEISEDDTDLSSIPNLFSLTTITIKNAKNVNISGVEKCIKLNSIRIWNSTLKSYEPIGKMGEKITRLYFLNDTQETVNKFINDVKEYNMPKLTYLGIWGCDSCGVNSEYGKSDFSVTSRNYFGSKRTTDILDISALKLLSEKTRDAIQYLYLENNKISDLSVFYDENDNTKSSFKNLIYLRMFGNNIKSLKGIENLKSLEYLQLACNIFEDSISRNSNDLEALKKDSLYYITSLNNLKWLDISNNTNIIYINYLKNLQKLKYLYMNGCGSLSVTEIIEMKEWIFKLSSYEFNNSYNKYLIDVTNTKNLSYANEKIDVNTLKMIGECKNLQVLDLTNTQIVKGQSEILSNDENTIDKIMIKTFKKLTNLQELSINNLIIDLDGEGGNNPQKIKKLDFMALTDSYDTSRGLKNTLRGLDLRNTDVIIMGENNKLSDENKVISQNNATILNSILSPKMLMVNTDTIYLGEITDLINRLPRDTYTSKWNIWQTNGFGLFCTNYASWKSLEGNKNIKQIVYWPQTSAGYLQNSEWNLDFSGCSSLTYVKLSYWYNFSVIWPINMKNLNEACCKINFSFGNASKGEKGSDVYLENAWIDEVGYESWSEFINYLSKSGVHVNKLEISSISSSGSSDCFFDLNNSLDWVEHVGFWPYGWGDWSQWANWFDFFKDLTTLKSVSINYYAGENLDIFKNYSNLQFLSINSTNVKNLNAISEKNELTNLSLNSSKITDISALSKLVNLKKLSLNNNQIISGMEVLTNFSKLESLDLRYNNFVIDEFVNIGTGDIKDEFLNIFINLHKNNCLNILYLNNTGLKNIREKLNIKPDWEVLETNS